MRSYNEIIHEGENGFLAPLVFDANGGMVRECQMLYQLVAEMIPEKRLKQQITFERKFHFLLKSALR